MNTRVKYLMEKIHESVTYRIILIELVWMRQAKYLKNVNQEILYYEHERLM
jgi:hypothetical protein